MNKVGRVLLVLGAVVLAFLIGVLVGRGQRSQAPPAEAAAGNSMQINTTAPPPAIQPLPATPPPAPKRAELPKLDPSAQVSADAAAVGMTTREPPHAAPPSSDQAAPSDSGAGATGAGDTSQAAPPNG